MANVANVRFYKLNVLPNFEAKHKGIFVHVAGIMSKEKNGTLLMNTDKLTLSRWLENRRIDKIESGLWFGGENGWELLSNETNSGAIHAAIEAKIATLQVDGYAQAEITTTTNSSTLTIKGIQEVDGTIGIPADSENLDLDIAIDGGYNESTNKIATQSTVTTAINGLNTTETIQAVTKTTETNGNTTLTFKGVQETNGVIAQGNGTDTFIVGDAKLKIQIGSAAASDVFSANATVDSTIQLNGNVFKKDGDVISVITPTAVSESNKLVTQQDIANLAGAMHYKTTIANADAWPQTVKAGDVYIATGENFEYNGQDIESGDMIVFNSESVSDFTVVQSNITLGTGDGQIAKNVGILSTNNNVVVATSEGIKTIEITETQLTGTDNNKRTLTIGDGDADGDFHHDVTITDDFTVIGKPFNKSIKISSTNRSIEIAKNPSDTGVVVDLVWNTSMDPDPNN